MILGSYEKQPDEIETYSINYADDLTAGDGITDCSISVTPSGLEATHHIVDGTRVRVTVTGGVHQGKYKITATVNTDDGRRLQDEFFVKVKEL